MTPRKGVIRLAGVPVGILEELDAGRTRFTYSQEWLSRHDAIAISLTLPLRDEGYVSNGLHPFFENLLPEGWLLELSTSKLKISKDDAMGLLLATCADCVGAVEVLPISDEVS
ncbi:MAG: HipA N-terminal domain-containing protein [Myxococcaceae bacterium]